MKKLAKTVLVASAFALSGSVFAAEISGSDVTTDVQVDNINQTSSGFLTENTVQAGNIKGGAKIKNSTIKTTVKTKKITQDASGFLNKNEVKLGTIE